MQSQQQTKILFGLGLALFLYAWPVTAQSTDPSLVWTKPAEVKRKPKPQHKAAPAPHKTESVPLLTLRWQVLTVGADGKDKAIDPKTFVFHNDDKLRFAVKVNQ